MIQEQIKNKQEILKSIAPCSMFCTTCTGCRYGKISYHAKELLKLLEGHEAFLDQNLKKQYRYKLEEYKLFSKKLKKYANPKCDGCRNNKSSSCCINGCIIPECTKEHQVDFCAECKDFPCDKINENIYKKETIEKWRSGNTEIREKGINKYYDEKKEQPHYINYVKLIGSSNENTKK